MKKIIFALSLSFITLISCNQKVDPPKKIDVQDLYSIEMPANLAPIPDLYPNADLQYGNTFLQTYIVTTKSSLDEDFATFVKEGLANYQDRENYKILKEDNVTINNLDGKLYELEMTQEGTYMFMIQAFLKGKKANYEVIAWTTGQNKDVEGKNLINIISSIKEY